MWRTRLVEEGRTRRHDTWSAGSGGREGDSRRRAPARTVKSRGPDTPMLVLRLRRRLRVAQATVANKPGAPGRSRSSCKTIAQGMPDVSAGPVVPAACIFFAGGPWARPAPGIPCALSLFEGDREPHDSGATGRENA